MARSALLLLVLGALASLVTAASPPTFCKCTCFTNSTIIPLGPGHEAPHPPAKPPAGSHDDDGTKSSSDSSAFTATPTLGSMLGVASPSAARAARSEERGIAGPAGSGGSGGGGHSSLLSGRAASSSCSQCNRAFCLQYNLPICKGAEEKDVVTMCFARDSQKDQIIVWAFILGTCGLLGWAAAQRAIEYREKTAAAASAPGGGGGSAGLFGRASAAPSGGGRRSAGFGGVRGLGRSGGEGGRGSYASVGLGQSEGVSSGLGASR